LALAVPARGREGTARTRKRAVTGPDERQSEIVIRFGGLGDVAFCGRRGPPKDVGTEGMTCA
jgi:hypothetical protein